MYRRTEFYKTNGRWSCITEIRLFSSWIDVSFVAPINLKVA